MATKMLIDGRKALLPGSMKRLGANVLVDWLKLQAGTANHGTIIFVVGGSTAVAPEATRRGVTPSLTWGTSLERLSVFLKGPLNLYDVWVAVEPAGKAGALTWLALRSE